MQFRDYKNLIWGSAISGARPSFPSISVHACLNCASSLFCTSVSYWCVNIQPSSKAPVRATDSLLVIYAYIWSLLEGLSTSAQLYTHILPCSIAFLSPQPNPIQQRKQTVTWHTGTFKYAKHPHRIALKVHKGQASVMCTDKSCIPSTIVVSHNVIMQKEVGRLRVSTWLNIPTDSQSIFLFACCPDLTAMVCEKMWLISASRYSSLSRHYHGHNTIKQMLYINQSTSFFIKKIIWYKLQRHLITYTF